MVRVHNEADELIGFYTEADYRIRENTKQLKIVRQVLHEVLEGTMNDEKVFVYITPWNTNTLFNLPWDYTLKYSEVIIDIKNDEVKDLYLSFYDEMLMVQLTLHDGTQNYGLINNGELIELGEHYKSSKDFSALAYINPRNPNELFICDTASMSKENFLLGDEINFFTISNHLSTIVTDQSGNFEIIKGESGWVFPENLDTEETSIEDEGTMLFTLENNQFVEVENILYPEIYETTTTTMLSIEDEAVYTIDIMKYKGENFFVKNPVLTGEFVTFPAATCQIFLKGEMSTNDGYRSLEMETLKNNPDYLLFNFNKNESDRYSNYTEHQYYLINKESGVKRSLNNLVKFSENDQYFLSAHVQETSANEIKVFDVKTLEVIHEFESHRFFEPGYQLSLAWNDNVIQYYVFKLGQNEWDNISNFQIRHLEYFDPVTGEEDAPILKSTEEVTLNFYRSPNTEEDLGEETVSVGDLNFISLVTYDGEIILWFKHELNGYTYRALKPNEALHAYLIEPIIFLDSKGTEYIHGNLEVSLTLANNVEFDHLKIHMSPLFGDEYDLYLNLKEGYQLTVDGHAKFSPEGNYLVNINGSDGYKYHEVHLWNLNTREVEFHHLVNESNAHNKDIYYKGLEWLDENTLHVIYSNYDEDIINVERQLVKSGDAWVLVNNDE